MANSLYQVTQGATVNAPDVNQLLQSFMGLYLVTGPFVQVATQQITTSAASITFSNIPQYNNLLVTWASNSSDTTGQTTDLAFQVNGDTGSHYNYQSLKVDSGTVTGAYVSPDINAVIAWQPTNAAGGTGTQGSGFLWLPNWSQFNATMNFVAVSTLYNTLNSPNSPVPLRVYCGNYTPASYVQRNSLTFTCGLGNFIPAGAGLAATSFTLYGSM